MSCPNCNYPVLTDIINYYNGIPYSVKGCPCCRWIPSIRINTSTSTTGNNIVIVDYQTTGSYINYNPEENR